MKYNIILKCLRRYSRSPFRIKKTELVSCPRRDFYQLPRRDKSELIFSEQLLLIKRIIALSFSVF